MPYFPDDVFQNICDFLLDFKKRHAEVWQTIRVKRDVATLSVVHEDTVEQKHDFYYTVQSGQHQEHHIKATFGKDQITGEWDNVYESDQMVNPDGSLLGIGINFHNYQFDQYGEEETEDFITEY